MKMEEKNENLTVGNSKGLKAWLIKEIMGPVMIGLVIFLCAGTIKWIHGWIFLGGIVLIKVLGDPWLLRTQKELLIKRTSSKGKANKPWDMILAPLVAFSSLGISVVAALDERFGWSSFERPWVIWVGLGLLLIGSLFIFWAMASNSFFDGTVNIQEGHTVATQGPYRFIRHPGYLGMFFMFLSIPLVLDSMVAYIPAVFFVLVLFLRTWLEDGTLTKELPGYAEYAREVKFRMFPNIW